MQQLTKEELKTQGTLIQSNNPHDLAISGTGYFQVQGEQGIYYTRRGDFHLNTKGELVCATGERVLGNTGTIQIDSEHFSIDKQGAISVDNHKIDQLQIAQFEHAEGLRYSGNGLYQTEESPITSSSSTKVLQGFIEQSNSKSIDEMLDMVSTSRHFEANQRIMRTADHLLATAINQLGESNV